jgi:hypothetical protein
MPLFVLSTSPFEEGVGDGQFVVVLRGIARIVLRSPLVFSMVFCLGTAI